MKSRSGIPTTRARSRSAGLGTAASFVVLAGSGVTDTGPTSVTGDVGTFPTPSETGMASVTLTGTDESGDAVTQQAKDDLVTAYNDAAGMGPVPVELGGTTLLPGVYTSGTFGLTTARFA
jgi:Ice-binding-like